MTLSFGLYVKTMRLCLLCDDLRAEEGYGGPGGFKAEEVFFLRARRSAVSTCLFNQTAQSKNVCDCEVVELEPAGGPLSELEILRWTAGSH